MGESLLPVLVFPLLVPVIVYGTSATERLFAGRPLAEVSGNLRLLMAFAIISTVASAVLFRFVIEE
jgi:heme exporter protein B